MTEHQHESLIKTPRQLLVTIIAAFLVPIVVIALLVSFVTSAKKTGEGSQGMSPEAVAARIAPVAKFEIVDASAPRALKSGEEVFKAVCTSCHGTGVAGAPKMGDGAAWAARIKEGAANLYEHAIKGYTGKTGMMPAKGGNSDLDDVEVQRAVVYLVNHSGGTMKEPEAPSAAARPQAAAAPAPPQADPNVVAAIAAINAGTKPAAIAVSAPAAGAGDAAGKKLYDTVCMVCHSAGVAGAPKMGDKNAWAPRLAEGMDTLYQHAIAGFQGKAGLMPAKGGANASDEDVKAAVRYMADASK